MTTPSKERIVQSLEGKARSFARDRGLYLLRIDVRGWERQRVIGVLLDGERAVAVADCEAVSKDLNAAIDAGNLVKGNYRLDVMSPGMDEPLTQDWQFKRSLGRLVEV